MSGNKKTLFSLLINNQSKRLVNYNCKENTQVCILATLCNTYKINHSAPGYQANGSWPMVTWYEQINPYLKLPITSQCVGPKGPNGSCITQYWGVSACEGYQASPNNCFQNTSGIKSGAYAILRTPNGSQIQSSAIWSLPGGCGRPTSWEPQQGGYCGSQIAYNGEGYCYNVAASFNENSFYFTASSTNKC